MMCIPELPELPGVDARLCRRYQSLVGSHVPPADRLAAGLRVPPGSASAFAAAQGAWRFYANPEVSLPRVAAPLVECARAGVSAGCDGHALVVLDWSPLHYNGHGSKADRVELSNRHDLGYELFTALAVSDRDGSPLAPVCLDLRAADGVHSTRRDEPLPAPSHLDGLGPVMAHAAAALGGLGKVPVFVIDREGDSVGHYRRWARAGRRFLARADDQPRAVDLDTGGAASPGAGGKGRGKGNGEPLSAIAERLRGRASGPAGAAGAFADVRGVLYKGLPARQFVAETAVEVRRPARTHRVDKKTGEARHRNIKGKPIRLRLVVSEVRNAAGVVLARWLLLTNLPADGPGAVPAATVALWYYWRWRVETYHKLLKGAGQQVEAWQQETAAATARRLAVAAMAAVVVWRLARDDSPAAGELRGVLVRLSGRQMKRGKGPDGTPARGFTEPALMAGLGVLLPMLELLNTHDPEHLRRLARDSLPALLPPARRDGG